MRAMASDIAQRNLAFFAPRTRMRSGFIRRAEIIPLLEYLILSHAPAKSRRGEDGRAVALDMLIEPDAGAGLGYDRCERGLADLKWIAPKIVAVEFDEVEGVEQYALVSALVTDEIERGNAVVIASDSFAIDDAGARAQAGQSIDDQRKATGEIIARTAVEPHS